MLVLPIESIQIISNVIIIECHYEVLEYKKEQIKNFCFQVVLIGSMVNHWQRAMNLIPNSHLVVGGKWEFYKFV